MVFYHLFTCKHIKFKNKMKNISIEKTSLTDEQFKLAEEFVKNMSDLGLVVELIGTRPNDR